MPEATLFGDDLPAAPQRPDLPDLQGSEDQVRWANAIRRRMLDELYWRLDEQRKLARIAGERGRPTEAIAAEVMAYASLIEELEGWGFAKRFIDGWVRIEERLGVERRTRETNEAVQAEWIRGLLLARGAGK